MWWDPQVGRSVQKQRICRCWSTQNLFSDLIRNPFYGENDISSVFIQRCVLHATHWISHRTLDDGLRGNEDKCIFPLRIELFSGNVWRDDRHVRTVSNVMWCLCYCLVSCFMFVCVVEDRQCGHLHLWDREPSWLSRCRLYEEARRAHAPRGTSGTVGKNIVLVAFFVCVCCSGL